MSPERGNFVGMEQSLDQVRQELADIHVQLLSLPADDFKRRSELKERQNELRQLSHKLLEGRPLHDREALRAAFDRLQSLRDHLLDQHLSTGGSTSVGDAGIESEFTAVVNKAIDAGLGLDEVEARLKEILQQMRSSS